MDNTVAGRALCLLAERHGDELLLEAGRELAHHLCARPLIGDGAFVSFSRAPLREPYGGEALPPDESELMADPGPGVYVDCLHFDPPFLVHLGVLLDDAAMVEIGASQALAYVSMLQDPDSGLFHHFWLAKTGRPYVLGWSRGQGWALLGLLDVLEHLPRQHAAWPRLMDAVRSLSVAMMRTQRPDGSWWAVAHVPASGAESSTAAFMAAGLWRAVQRGWLEPRPGLDAAKRAWAATSAATGEDGVLTGVSAAVWSSTRESHYHHVPRGFVVPWGQGPLLLAASAWLSRGARGPVISL